MTSRKRRIALAWSGGKDSTTALRQLSRDPDLEVAALLTTVTREPERISIHGVRRDLLHQQAKSLRLRLMEVFLGERSSNEDYEAAMSAALEDLRAEGVDGVAFGDLFLADIRQYREQQMARAGMEPLFPLWGQDTAILAREFIGAGFRAVVTCVDTQQLDASFVGRDYDSLLLSSLPRGVDPCGENGEFHTFVSDGPMFTRPIEWTRGRLHWSDDRRFCFQDLVGR